MRVGLAAKGSRGGALASAVLVLPTTLLRFSFLSVGASQLALGLWNDCFGFLLASSAEVVVFRPPDLDSFLGVLDRVFLDFLLFFLAGSGDVGESSGDVFSVVWLLGSGVLAWSNLFFLAVWGSGVLALSAGDAVPLRVDPFV